VPALPAPVLVNRHDRSVLPMTVNPTHTILHAAPPENYAPLDAVPGSSYNRRSRVYVAQPPSAVFLSGLLPSRGRLGHTWRICP
jgi:hypothetical protein